VTLSSARGRNHALLVADRFVTPPILRQLIRFWHARLRNTYPFESMEHRVPAPMPETRDAPLAAAYTQRLDRLEEVIGFHSDSFR
jgi:hypothetical protein